MNISNLITTKTEKANLGHPRIELGSHLSQRCILSIKLIAHINLYISISYGEIKQQYKKYLKESLLTFSFILFWYSIYRLLSFVLVIIVIILISYSRIGSNLWIKILQRLLEITRQLSHFRWHLFKVIIVSTQFRNDSSQIITFLVQDSNFIFEDNVLLFIFQAITICCLKHMFKLWIMLS